MPDEIAISLISSVLGGLLVALTNNLLIRRKTEAETLKLRAETEKVKAEADKIKAESKKLSASLVEANYYAVTVDERILYDGRSGIEGYDIRAVGAGKNFHEIRNGVLIVRRTSDQRVYQIHLRKYVYEKREREYLPRNGLLTGPRKLRVSCEVKIVQGYHSLLFAITSVPQDQLLDRNEVVVDRSEWTEVDLYFKFPAHYDCILQIVDLPKSQPGSLFLRKLVLAERAE
jgi:hypothetical protein